MRNLTWVLLAGLLLTASSATAVYDEDADTEFPELPLIVELRSDCDDADCFAFDGDLRDIRPGMVVRLELRDAGAGDVLVRVITVGHMDDEVDSDGESQIRSEVLGEAPLAQDGNATLVFDVPGDAHTIAFLMIEDGEETARLEQELPVYTIQFGEGLPEPDRDPIRESGPASEDEEVKDTPGVGLVALLAVVGLALARRR